MDDTKIVEFYLQGYKNLKIYTHHWAVSSPRAVMVIAHGFGEHSQRYDHVADFFNKMNIAVIGVDHYGHGQTEGLKGHVEHYDLFLEEIHQVLEYAAGLYPGIPQNLYGHSMGGNIVLNYIFKKKPALLGAIVTGSWIDLAAPAPAFKVLLGKLLRNVIPKMLQPTNLDVNLLSHDTAVTQAYTDDPLVQTKISNALGIDMLKSSDFLRNFSGKMNFPLLIMHGGEDQIIDPDGSVQLAKRLSGPVTLKVWDNLYHEIHNEFEKQEVLEFTKGWLESAVFTS